MSSRTELAWPARKHSNLRQNGVDANCPSGKYIVQVARFDPSKGVPTVIDSYAEFRRMCEEEDIEDVPQLCM